MNAEKLHAIAEAIHDDLVKSNVIDDLEELSTNLKNLVNQPNQPQYQRAVSEYRETLRSSLLASSVNEFSPIWKQVVSELGGDEILGYPLSFQLDQIFSENQITPDVAHNQIEALLERLKSFSKSIDEIISAFGDLHIGKEDLAAGECEIGVLIPRVFVSNRLDKFADEVENLDKIFGVFSELVTGSRPGFQIRAISSSDLSIFLEAAPGVCAAVAFAIERIVNLYKSLLEIKKLRAGLVEQGLGEESLKGVEDFANNSMEDGIEKLISQLEERYLKDTEAGRKNELSIALRISLKKIANRIDRGFNIEVRMSEPAIEREEGGANNDPSPLAAYREIKAASETMQYINATGEPILMFPESQSGAPL